MNNSNEMYNKLYTLVAIKIGYWALLKCFFFHSTLNACMTNRAMIWKCKRREPENALKRSVYSHIECYSVYDVPLQLVTMSWMSIQKSRYARNLSIHGTILMPNDNNSNGWKRECYSVSTLSSLVALMFLCWKNDKLW